jgi:ABC-type transport system involved in Fe-S cluster assembly fused permease/ATPase subunit
VPNASNEELEGITLSVYLYTVRKGKPVGPRDVMKGADLSSPSVAYRHLQKLEDMGYLQKNNYGEYVTKGKASVRGYMWIGRRMLPKMLVYALVFMSILIVELVVFALHYSVENYMFKVFFVLLILVTVLAMAVFTVEALLHHKRTNLRQNEQTHHSNSTNTSID